MLDYVRSAFQLGPNRYTPDPDYGTEKFSERFLARSIGCVALAIPLSAILGSALGLCWFDSLSHYYYAPVVGDLFVGLLFVNAVLLLGFRGESLGESRLAALAGVFAIGVALAPTTGNGCLERSEAPLGFLALSEISAGYLSSTTVGALHVASAGVLLVVLAYYAGAVFTRPIPELAKGDTALTPQKKEELRKKKALRNRFYFGAASVIGVCVAVLVVRGGLLFFVDAETPVAWWHNDPASLWRRWNITFWLEVAALVAFGVSWLVKGRVLNWFDDGRLR